MAPPIDKLFLIVAIVALPNMYHRAEYNVPLMIFCFVMWDKPAYHSIIAYLLVFSWMIDVIRLVKDVTSSGDPDGKQPQLVVIVEIVVFVLKIIVIILMLVFDQQSRKALAPNQMCTNFRNTFIAPKSN